MKTRFRQREAPRTREEKSSRHRRLRIEREIDDFTCAKTKVQIRSGPDPARNGGSGETAAAGLAFRCRIDGISSASPQWAHHERTQKPRSGVDTVRLREVAG